MFITIRKKTIALSLAILLIMFAALGLLYYSAEAAYSAPKIGKTIVIDAGHGGIDGGVVGKNTGVKESEINLAISKSLKHFLLTKGYDVVMTRENSDGLYGLAATNKKLRDMEARRDIINEAKPDLVISIHQNYYSLTSVNGPQVFYDSSSEKAKSYAETFQRILNTALDNTRAAKTGDYYMLKCTQYPSLIVECGFLSNPEEEKLLVTSAYQEKVAYTIFSAIHTVLSDGQI